MDWVQAVLNAPGAEKLGIFLIAIALVTILDRRLLTLIKETQRLTGEISSHNAQMNALSAQYSRHMQEVRSALAALVKELLSLRRGDDDGTKGSLHKPVDR